MDINKFCNHIQAEGFILYPANVKADGRWHNCRLVDNAKGKAAGAYKILNDSIAFYKNWRDGKVKPFTDSSLTSKYEHEKLRKLLIQQELELKQQHFEASKQAYNKYMSIQHNSNIKNEYLSRKSVGIYGCKIDENGNLIIPFYNEKGYLRTLQTIQSDGFKMFEKGAEVKGNYHKIYFGLVEREQSKYFGKIFVGEGYATMATIHEATKYPCVLAANAGNLKPVIEKLAILYPKAQFVICADNDLSLREHLPGSEKMFWANPGVEAAIECCNLQTQKMIKVLIPDFSHIKHEHNFTDYNDLHCYSGIESVKAQIRQGLIQLNSKVSYG
jgi:putative DNA primase/helicase